MTALRHKVSVFLIAVGGIALILKLVPLWRFGPFGYGHDVGFYRRYVIQPFVSFPNTPVPGLDHTVFTPRILLDVVRFVIHQPDIVLYGSYIVLSLVAVYVVWRYVSTYLPQTESRYAAILYTVSGVQFLAYTNFFFKEALALPLFFGSLIFLEKRKYTLATMLGILVIVTQQTTSIILICIGGLGFIIRSFIDKKISLAYVFSGTAILASYLLLHPHVAQKIASPPVGIFLTQSEYLLLSIPLFVLAATGMRPFVPTLKKNALLSAALLVPLIFAIGHLPFYNRIYIFLDMFLVLPAALGITVIVNRFSITSRAWKSSLTAIIFLAASVPLIYVAANQSPPISSEAQQALHELSALPQNASIITSPSLLPWVQGWSLTHVYAPGNLKEPHALDEWGRYWIHQDLRFEKEFLSTFPEPSYVFADSNNARYRPSCGVSASPFLTDLGPCFR